MTSQTERFRARLIYFVVGVVILSVTYILLNKLADLEEQSRQMVIANQVRQERSIALWRLDTWLSGKLNSESLRFRFEEDELCQSAVQTTDSSDESKAEIPPEKWIDADFQVSPQGRWRFQPLGQSAISPAPYRKIEQSASVEELSKTLSAPSVQKNISTRPASQIKSVAKSKTQAADVQQEEYSNRQEFFANSMNNFNQIQQTPLRQNSRMASRSQMQNALPPPDALSQTEIQLSPQTINDLNLHQVEYNNQIDARTLLTALLEPRWIGGELIFIRKTTNPAAPLEGSVINLKELYGQLREQIADLFPAAQFAPIRLDCEAGSDRLAAAPIQLLNAVWPEERIKKAERELKQNSSLKRLSPMVWISILGAYLSLGLLISQTLRLSQRREEFVAAVSHELRTPLTTFMLYSEMLDGNKLTLQQQNLYASTLHSEAIRLSMLIENLMALSRLYRGKQAEEPQKTNLAQWLEQIQPRLEVRLQRAKMTLEIAIQTDDSTAVIRPLALEQVVTNLVDNACKFAQDSSDKRVIITLFRREEKSLGKRDARLILSVRDFGPGFGTPAAISRVISEHSPLFTKTVQTAATEKPGIGLGLPLCVRLLKTIHAQMNITAPDSGSGAVIEIIFPN